MLLLYGPMDFVCDDLYCPSVDLKGEPMYKDRAHLRPSYVRQNASFIDTVVTSR